MKFALVATSTVMVASSLLAADSTWNGSIDNDMTTADNWTPSGVPNLNAANTAIINSGTVQRNGTTAPDLTVGNGGVLQINGGSFTQIGSGDWMQLPAGGTINVAGGSFNTGTAPRINNVAGTFNLSSGSATISSFYLISGGAFNVSGGTGVVNTTFSTASGSSLSVSGGSLTLSTGNLNISSGFNFSLTGGTLSLSATSEFQPNTGSFVNINGGILNAYVLSFNGADTILNLSSGTINLSGGGHFNGIFGGGANKYVNFTNQNQGSLFIDNLSEAGKNALLASQSIRYLGDASSPFLQVTPSGSGYVFTAVPEPSTYAAIIGLGCVGLIVLRRRKAARVS